jgi:hypothetical protein
MTELQVFAPLAIALFLLFGAGTAYFFLRRMFVRPLPIAEPVTNTKPTAGRDVYLGRGYPHPEPLASWFLMTMADAERVTKHQCFRCCWEFLGEYGIQNREDLEFNIGYCVDPRRADRGNNNVAWNTGQAMYLLLHGAGAGLLSYDEAWSRIRPIAEGVRHHYTNLRSFHEDWFFQQRVFLKVPTDGSADPSYMRPRVAIMERYLSGEAPMPADWNAPLHAPLADISSHTLVPADPLFSWLCMLTAPLDDQDLPFFWHPPRARKVLKDNWDVIDRPSFEFEYAKLIGAARPWNQVLLVRATIAAFRAGYIDWDTLWRALTPLLLRIQSEHRDFHSFWDAALEGARDANGLAHDGSQDESDAFVKKCAANRRKWASRDVSVDFHTPLG